LSFVKPFTYAVLSVTFIAAANHANASPVLLTPASITSFLAAREATSLGTKLPKAGYLLSKK
jgi:hypothetical protein